MSVDVLPRPLLDLLVQPGTNFELDHAQGRLVGADGRSYEVRNGIPRFGASDEAGQQQTADSFGYQWQRTEAYGSPGMRDWSLSWLLDRYGFATARDMRTHFESVDRVLDLGCGGGFSASLWMDGWSGGTWVGVDISDAIDVAKARLGHNQGTCFVQADIAMLPFRPGSFDIVFSEGVLHHTPSTRAALETAVVLLAPGGEIMFYVYRTKAPMREFADDYVRAQLANLSEADAWIALRSLTDLGRALAATGATVEVTKDVPLLGIPAGSYDVQRLIYWYFAKLFWNDGYTFEENNHINFDWYRPQYSHRQSEGQVRAWCEELGLRIDRFYVDDAGITVRARCDAGTPPAAS